MILSLPDRASLLCTITMRAEPAPMHSPERRLSRTIPALPSRSSAPPAHWHTAARVEPAPMHCPEQRLSRTIPVLSHSPVVHLDRWRTSAQDCIAPAQYLGQRLAP